MIKIGDFSKLCQLTVKTLRYYADIKLLEPVHINEENGYRYYKPEQLFLISEITQYKNMGFSLDEIKSIIEGSISNIELQELIKVKKRDIKEAIQLEQLKLEKVNAFQERINLKLENLVMEKVVIKELPKILVASLREVIPNYKYLHKLTPEMGQIMGKQGAVCAEPFYCFNIYHDKEYKVSDIDVEICEAVKEVPKNVDVDKRVIYKEMDKISAAACIMHRGPYEKLGESYGRIFKWLEENEYEVSDLMRESFIDGCWNKENPEDWLTEIQVPIKKK